MYRKSGKYKNYCRKRRKRKDDILKSVIKILKGMIYSKKIMIAFWYLMIFLIRHWKIQE